MREGGGRDSGVRTLNQLNDRRVLGQHQRMDSLKLDGGSGVCVHGCMCVLRVGVSERIHLPTITFASLFYAQSCAIYIYIFLGFFKLIFLSPF